MVQYWINCQTFSWNISLRMGLWSPKALLVWKSYEKAMGRPQTTLEEEILPIWKSYRYGKTMGNLWDCYNMVLYSWPTFRIWPIPAPILAGSIWAQPKSWWEDRGLAFGLAARAGLPMNSDVLNIFFFVATYHGAVVEQLSNFSWKYFWGWDCDHPRNSWYGKAMRKLWEGHKPHLRERSCLYGGAIGMEKLWESYGNSRNIILLHKVFHSSMKKCYEKPKPFFAMRNRCRDHSRHGSLGTTIPLDEMAYLKAN